MTEEFGTFLGRDNAVKLTSTAGSTQRFVSKDFGIGAGESVRFTAQIYVPSTNTALDSFAYSEKFDVSGFDRKQGVITPTQDQWVDIDFNYVQVDDTFQRIIFWNSASSTPTANNNSSGDVIYFRNMVVTRVAKGQNNAIQETAANQPKIAENGSVFNHINFDGNTFLNIGANLMDATDGTTSMVMSNIDIDVQTFYLSNRGGNNGFNFFNDTGGEKGKFKYAFVGSGASLTSNAFVSDNSNNKFLVTFTKDSNDREFFGNGAVLADDGASNTYVSAGATNTSIGKQGNSSTASTSKLMRVYEIVSYNTDRNS